MSSRLIDFLLSADSSRFRAGLADAERSSRGTTQNIGRDFNQLNRTLRTVVGVVAALAGAGGFVALARQVTSTADELSKLSRQTGESVENLSTLVFVTEQAGASQEGLTVGLRNISRGLLEAERGSGNYGRALADLGIETKNLDGTTRSSYDVLLDIADLFQQLPDGPTKLALAYEVLGRQGQQLIPLLNQGREGIIAQQDAARELGIEIDTRTAQAAERFNDAMSALGATIQGTVRQGLAPLLPTLAGMTEELAAAQSGAGGFAREVGQGARVGLLIFSGAMTAMRTGIRQFVFLVSGSIQVLQKLWARDFKGAADAAKFALSEIVREGDDWAETVRRMSEIEERGNAVIAEQTRLRLEQEAQQRRNEAALVALRKRNEELAAAERERARLQQQAAGVIDGLRRELALIDAQTNAERLRYEVTSGAYRDFDQASKNRILLLAEELEAEQQMRAEREKARREAEQQARDLQALADGFVRSTRTQLELLEQERQQLESIRDLIDGETYDRALKSIEDRIAAIGEKTNEWEEFTLQAARNMQDAFADFLFDPFEDGLRGMVRGFADSIRRMVSELLAQQILRSFFGAVGGGAAFGFAHGGQVFGPGTSTSDSIPARLSRGEFVQPARSVDYYGADFMEAIRRRQLPRFATGGLVGRSNIAHFAEGGPVTGSGSEGGGGVRIINTLDPDIVSDYVQSAAGERTIVNVIRKNAGAVRNALG